MTETIRLGAREFELRPLTLGQLRQLLDALDAMAGKSGGALIDAAARVLQAGLAAAHPDLTLEALLECEASLVELNTAVAAILPGLSRSNVGRVLAGLESLVGNLVDVRAAPIDDALDLLQSGTPTQAYHLPNGIELCLLSDIFILRLHGRARPRTRPNTWDSEVPRV